MPAPDSAWRGDAARGRAAALLAALWVLIAPGADGATPVGIHVQGDDGRPLAGVAVVAHCPDGGEWRAVTDARGFALLAEVPACALAVAAAGEARTRAERFDGSIGVRRESDSLAGDLPSSRSAWSWLETVEPAAVVDRIDGAGLYPAEAGRFSMRGASWTQNTVRLDGVDVTDRLRGGTPLLLPDVDGLSAIEATSALAPAEYASPGVTLSLASREPAASWRGGAQAYGLASGGPPRDAPGAAPAIARFGSLVDASVVAGGPVAGPRLRLLAAGRLVRARRFERGDPAALESRLATGSIELAWRAGAGDTLHLLASAQAADRPLAARARFAGEAPTERDDARGALARWTHAGERTAASVSAGLWSATLVPRTAGRTAGETVERLRDGPVPDLAFPALSRRSSWSLGGRVALRAARLGGAWHAPRFGLDLERAWSDERPGLDGPIPETVGGLAARVWDYTWAGTDSRRHALDLGAWAGDRIVWRERLFVDAGLRLERTTGAAQGAAQGVAWTKLLPRLSTRWRLSEAGRLTLVAGWGEYRHRLLLGPLAFGDPNAAHASVYRWSDANGDGRYQPAERGVLVARVGPGAGDGSLAGIDPGLRPPRTREIVAGLELSGEGWLASVTVFDRRESDLIESVDVGAPLSAYSVHYLPDPGGDVAGTQDDQQLPVFERRPESFGLDRYLLTNPAGHTGRHQGVELRAEKTLGTRFALFAGGTAGRTEIQGGNRGFGVSENDQGVVGELFDDPNADTYARGRGFFDRAYTLELAAAWRAPREWRFALVARYQDGQPFGRLVVVPDLAQGPEAIPATTRGQTFGRVSATDPEGRPLGADGHRFTFTLTVDARVEKGVRFSARRLALVAEVFNLLGQRHEVEEDAAWGAGFRDPTALQPPRAVRLGVCFDF